MPGRKYLSALEARSALPSCVPWERVTRPLPDGPSAIPHDALLVARGVAGIAQVKARSQRTSAAKIVNLLKAILTILEVA